MPHAIVETVALSFRDDGSVPNHPRFPLLLYRAAIAPSGGDAATAIEATFAANGWGGLWRNGVYPFHHYHSSCHEALGVARGWVEVLFGGQGGEMVRLAVGDVAVVPAGTGHKRISASDDFLIVGAYPSGQPYDMIRGDDANAHDGAVARIAETPRPATDPVFGADGGLKERWTDAG